MDAPASAYVTGATLSTAATFPATSGVFQSAGGGNVDAFVAKIAVVKASPTISTQASAGGPVGMPVHDVATLAGGSSPTGTVTFRLFSDADCQTQVYTSTNPVLGATATSGVFPTTAAAIYRWTAVYSGDANNNPATSACNAPNESVTITAFQAPAITRTITGDLLGPVTVTAGESVLITGARVVGPGHRQPGGALTVVSSRSPAASSPPIRVSSASAAPTSTYRPGTALECDRSAGTRPRRRPGHGLRR